MEDYNYAEAARINSGTRNNTVVMKLSMRQIAKRQGELMDCASVDPSKSDDYNHELGQYVEAHNDRYKMFVERHKLTQQVYKEDDAGLR